MNPPSSLDPLLLKILDVPIQIYTMRITLPPPLSTALNQVIDVFKNENKFLTYIISLETSRKEVNHLHIRFSIARQEIAVRNLLKNRLLFLEGNGTYQLKKIKQKVNKILQIVYKNKQKILDVDSIWKSASYICKDGDIQSYRGYTPDNIASLTNIGKSLKPEVNNKGEKKRSPIYLQIIHHYSLQEKNLYDVDAIALKVCNFYYQSMGKYPSAMPLQNCLHNIYMKLSSIYAESFINSTVENFKNTAAYRDAFDPVHIFKNVPDNSLDD